MKVEIILKALDQLAERYRLDGAQEEHNTARQNTCEALELFCYRLRDAIEARERTEQMLDQD